MNNKLFWHIIGGCVAGLVALEVVAFQKPKWEMEWFQKGQEDAINKWHSDIFNNGYDHGQLRGLMDAMHFVAEGKPQVEWSAWWVEQTEMRRKIREENLSPEAIESLIEGAENRGRVVEE